MTKGDKKNLLAKFVAACLVAGLFASLMPAPVAAQRVPPNVRQFGPRVKRAPQPRQPKGPPPTIIAKNGHWVVQCDRQKPKADGKGPQKRNCGMIQSVQSKKNKRIAMTLILIKATKGKKSAIMMRLLAPIGVFLPTGVALEIDGKAVGRVPFTRCLPQACIAFAEARKETLAKMKKGKTATFLMYEAPGIGVPLNLSLEGFSASLKVLDKLK